MEVEVREDIELDLDKPTNSDESDGSIKLSQIPANMKSDTAAAAADDSASKDIDMPSTSNSGSMGKPTIY